MGTEELLAGLTAAGALPTPPDPWTEQQRWIAEAGERLVELGVDVSAVVRVVRLGTLLARIEVDTVVSDVGEGSEPEAALARQAQRRQAVTRLIAAVRHASVSRAVRRLTGIGDQFHEYASELLHVPSTLYIHQHGLTASVGQLRARAEESGEPGDGLLLGRLLIGLGRYAEAGRWFERVSRAPETGGELTQPQPLTPTDRGVALAHLAVTRVFLGQEGAGVRACAEALELAPDSAVVLALAAVVYSFEAGTASDFGRAAAAVGRVMELLERSRQCPPAGPLEHLEALVARGRISLLMPRGMGVYQKGVADLRAVLAAVSSAREHGAPPGADGIFELHAAYFLGMNHPDPDRTEAIALLQRVVVLDPASPFAERAYRRIGELLSAAADPAQEDS